MTSTEAITLLCGQKACKQCQNLYIVPPVTYGVSNDQRFKIGLCLDCWRKLQSDYEIFIQRQTQQPGKSLAAPLFLGPQTPTRSF